VSDLAGDSVPVSTYIDPSCCRRSEDFSDGGGKGLSKTESYTDSMPVGPSGSSFDLLEYFDFLVLSIPPVLSISKLENMFVL